MKLLRADVTNFVSYSHLSFDFNDQGLALIYGATGSGKSTLQDIPAWVLFNTTAKGTAVDEVRNWAHLDEPTEGAVTLELNGETITVTRTRGKATQNDLYWEDNDGLHRGKDITETQALLEAKLGVSKDLYVAAAYYNEFSPTSAFFTAKAKDRRELFENLADLSFPIDLAARVSEAKKDAKKELKTVNDAFFKQSGIVESMRNAAQQAEEYAESWRKQHANKITELKVKADNFDKEKQSKIEAIKLKMHVADEQMLKEFNALTHKYNNMLKRLSKEETQPNCTTCGQPIKEHMDAIRSKEKIEHELKQFDLTRPNPHGAELAATEAWENPYYLQLKAESERTNPHEERIEKLLKDLWPAQTLLEELADKVYELEDKINMLDQLYDLSFKLRGELLRQSIKHVEANTNRLLDTYFDSALRVTFELSKLDDLNVVIAKNGNECSYRQLSKGQRGLLKLCFSISIMEIAANKAGLKFETLFFDEALDGLDTELKLKAYNLFSELETSHSSVLVIDHNSELQSLFTKQFYVKLVNEESEITKQ